MSRWSDLQSTVKPVFDIQDNKIPDPETVAPEGAVASSPAKYDEFLRQIEKLPKVGVTVIHYRVDGIYAREHVMPAGSVVLGKRHKATHMLAVLAGDVTIIDDVIARRVQAPYVEEAAAGIRRVVVAHADSVILTTHANPDNLAASEMESELVDESAPAV